ncbi:M20 family metallo-hydrolase [Streptomyces sp. NPDC050504]|uniref:M20 family metallo-hydrolase n=1 Tax=Streptomyces sp. NPDC050504 TaxID=3365618 RepID=UPI0037B88843
MTIETPSPSTPAGPTDLAADIDGERLLGRIEAFGKIGYSGDGGVTRAGFDDADIEARLHLVREAQQAGLVARVDAGGNVLIRRPPGLAARGGKALLIGSHLDTVVNGGRLDGAYGVLAGLEVLQVLTESRARLPYEPVVIAFANEEGALFPQPFWGSMVLAGRLAGLPDDPRDVEGRSLRGPLARLGGNLDALEEAVWSSDDVAAYLELHIEQGPVLEQGGQRIGVVEAITGRTVLTADVHGASGHAGTTPMEHRRDALTAAARMITSVERTATDDLCRVATVGRLEAFPNSPNTIAGAVRLTIDLRDTDAQRLERAEAAVRDDLAALAELTGTRLEFTAATKSAPVATDPALRAAIAESADELGLSRRELPSGAGHDAQVVADIAPIGMIFVPSIEGLSHRPDEDTSPADLVAGARVLLRTALRV